MSELSIFRGDTLRVPIYASTSPVVYKAITGVPAKAPLRLTVVAHGLTDNWQVAITNVKGMTELNAEANKVKTSDYKVATVVDVDTIEINSINAAGFKEYVSGGVVQYETPLALAGCTGRAEIRNKIDGTVLASTDDILTLTLDDLTHTVTLEIAAADTAALTWSKGVLDIEITDGAGVVTTIVKDVAVVVVKDVTK